MLRPMQPASSGWVTSSAVLRRAATSSPWTSSPTDSDQVAALKGRVLRVRLSQDWIDDPDPAVGGLPGANEWPWLQQLLYATTARLLTYPNAPAPAGWQLVPEIAWALPTVSRDGRTYTFQIRHGFRFSPPSNQSVTGKDASACTIERASHHSWRTTHLRSRLPIPTSKALPPTAPGRHDTSRGFASTAGRSASPSCCVEHPDFPERIALTYFAPVPIEHRRSSTGSATRSRALAPTTQPSTTAGRWPSCVATRTTTDRDPSAWMRSSLTRTRI